MIFAWFEPGSTVNKGYNMTYALFKLLFLDVYFQKVTLTTFLKYLDQWKFCMELALCFCFLLFWHKTVWKIRTSFNFCNVCKPSQKFIDFLPLKVHKWACCRVMLNKLNFWHKMTYVLCIGYTVRYFATLKAHPCFVL